MVDGADESDGAVGREYRTAVPRTGGFTPLPGWVTEPGSPGAARTDVVHTSINPAGIGNSRIDADLLLAVHAKVVAALTGDRETVAGFQPTHGHTVPVQITVAEGSWRELRAATADVLLASLAADAALGLGTTATDASAYDTLVAARGLPTALPPGVVLAVAVAGDRLLLRHRADVLDTDAAHRIAGYLGTALRHALTEPGADHHDLHLLGADELRFQAEQLAGPTHPLPDRRVHELVEEQARRCPDAVAVEHGRQSLTYGELNRRANRIAWRLRQAGLVAEGVVGVVTERHLDWACAVLGILKAGGAYLPVEPHLPADRITKMLGGSGCRLVLARTNGPGPLRHALAALGAAAPTVLAVDRSRGPEPDHDPALAVPADGLAYVFFTSGSTGEPKGAMCEHAGFLNHLLAKIEDLGITADSTVAQTAPQGFDISLWQLMAALTVGGRTHIVEQAAIVDIGRFVDTLVTARVQVAQLVPSYLEVLLTWLDGQPERLPDLRIMSATGETLKKELVQRWFRTFPTVPLVNAYGLTETSDDTNHEVMRIPPAGESVPLGRPLRNVRIRIADERMRPVPLGAPGEIIIAGVSVGRGYVHDEQRTAAAFLPDPDDPGGRLYRSGDFGRWTPEGQLEFHGRRDAQVKIRGLRIEIGEIENRLMRVAGVRDAAVVVADGGQDRFLVGYCTWSGDDEPTSLREQLAAGLPAYMVPTALVVLDAMPLTPNGKIDRSELVRRARDTTPRPADDAAAAQEPRTDTERLVATLWSQALRVPVHRIRRNAHFFVLGGTSLSAVRLAMSLDRQVTVGELAAHPVLFDLAALLDERAAARGGLTVPAAPSLSEVNA